MSAIRGSLRKLAIKRTGGSWEDVAHVISDSWQTSTNFLSTTTRENAGFETDIPISQSSSIQVSAVVFQDADLTSKIGYKTLKEVQDARERVEYRLEASGENFTYYGVCHIENTSDSADVGDLFFYEFTLKVYGKPVVLGDDTAPTAPTLFLIYDDTNEAINLSWSGATDDIGVTGYEIRKSQTSQPDEFIDVGNVTSWIDNAVAQGQFYSYNVRAYDVAGNNSPWSNKVGFTIPIPSSPPDQTTPFLFQDGAYMQFQDGELTIFQD